MSWAALGEALPQAVAIAISPIPVVSLILMLVSPRSRSIGPPFALAWVIGVAGLTLVAFALADGSDVASDPDASDGGNALQVLAGLAFAVLAVRQWQKRPRAGEEATRPKIFAAVETMTPLRSFAIGLAVIIVNPKNVMLAISAGLQIAQAGPGTSSGVVAILLFSVIASSTALAAVASVLIFGERARPPLDALEGWLLANSSTIMLVLYVVLAAAMLGSGLAIFA